MVGCASVCQCPLPSLPIAFSRKIKTHRNIGFYMKNVFILYILETFRLNNILTLITIFITFCELNIGITTTGFSGEGVPPKITNGIGFRVNVSGFTSVANSRMTWDYHKLPLTHSELETNNNTHLTCSF